jgi:hypothetical protein
VTIGFIPMRTAAASPAAAVLALRMASASIGMYTPAYDSPQI